MTEPKPQATLARVPKPPLVPLRAPHLIVDDFLADDLAQAMRNDIDEHFARPDKHRPATHQVWNYWFVPNLYTYLRTQPEKVIRPANMERFFAALQRWAGDTLGLGMVTWPFLSLYVDGCGQGLHNDSKNGRFGYVYSLTPLERRSIGGETIVLREGDPFRRNLRKANAGTGLYDLIEPRFNRLVLFDDRMVHGVQRVAGSMDPLEGRCVLHGHIEEAGAIVTGALPREAVGTAVRAAISRFASDRLQIVQRLHGPLVVRLSVAAPGKVMKVRVLLDRVMHEQSGNAEWEPVKLALLESFGDAPFPPAPGETSVTVPVTFGGAVRAEQP
jgi:hypothetical protein